MNIYWEARAKLLEAENETLREQNRQLKEEIGLASQPPPMFNLTTQEAAVFGVLLANRAPRKSTFTALYSDGAYDDEAGEKIIDVWICKIRKKLKPFGIDIKTNWGESYDTPEASKARARELMAET